MIRTTWVVVGLLMLSGPVQQTIDAVQFVQAFRDGTAARFNNRKVAGTGVNFHGVVNERIADGTTRTSLVITIGSGVKGSALKLLKTVDEFIAAEKGRTTLVIALSGPNLPPPTDNSPQTYEFSGIYNGQVRTVPRAGASISTASDEGPCKGERPQEVSEQTFYCAPLLVNAAATIKQ